MVHAVTVGADGRVTIPAELCRELGLEPGDDLVVHRSGDGLVLARPDAARPDAARPDAGRSLADVIWASDESDEGPTSDWLADAG